MKLTEVPDQTAFDKCACGHRNLVHNGNAEHVTSCDDCACVEFRDACEALAIAVEALEGITSYMHEEAECPAYFNDKKECECFVGTARSALARIREVSR